MDLTNEQNLCVFRSDGVFGSHRLGLSAGSPPTSYGKSGSDSVVESSVDKLTNALDVNLLLALSSLGNVVRSLHAHERVHLHAKRLFDAEGHISREIGLRIHQAG